MPTYNFVDRTGHRIGRLSVISKGEPIGTKTAWLCQCDCGNFTTVRTDHLKEARVKSCGCFSLDSHTSHGLSRSPTYSSWQHLKNRCLNPEDKGFPEYGGRGIAVCDRWLTSFENFLSDMGEKPEGTSIDRIDNNGDYTPENCRWADSKTQVDNRRNSINLTIDGETLVLKDWAARFDKCYQSAIYHFHKGHDVEAWLKAPRKRSGPVYLEIDGEVRLLKEWCETYGKNLRSAYNHRYRGTDIVAWLKS